MEPTKSRSKFTRFAKWASRASGRPGTFVMAAAAIVVWGVSGPLFGFSDTWQLIINTSTTIVTFLMVFLIQSTQNRDTKAMQVKLDELIRVASGAHVALLDIEELEEEELEGICEQYEDLARRARKALRQGKSDTDVPELEPPARTSRQKRKR